MMLPAGECPSKNMKRASEYTEVELLGLSNEEFSDAIRREAIYAGIKIPVTYSEALRSSEWRGYSAPAEGLRLYEVLRPGQYREMESSGIAYLSEERARAALEGAVGVYHDTYGEKAGPKMAPQSAGFSIRAIVIGTSPATQAFAKLEEANEDTSAFDKLRDEWVERLREARQRAYNRQVRAERRIEYLRLAGGDETIARAFWNRAEGTNWPTEDGGGE